MFVVVAVYPSGRRVLVGFGHSQIDVDEIINDCIAQNGTKRLKDMGIRFDVELTG